MSPLLRLESCALEKHVGGLTPERRKALLSGIRLLQMWPRSRQHHTWVSERLVSAGASHLYINLILTSAWSPEIKSLTQGKSSSCCRSFIQGDF